MDPVRHARRSGEHVAGGQWVFVVAVVDDSFAGDAVEDPPCAVVTWVRGTDVARVDQSAAEPESLVAQVLPAELRTLVEDARVVLSDDD
jgi:hypothetical protein